MLVNKKMILIATLTAVALLAFTYGTYAYLSEQATIEDSRITPGNISIELLEMTLPTGGDTPVPQSEPIHIMPGAEVSKRVSVKNTGTLPTYVRIKIAPSVMLAEDAAERADEVDLSLIRLNVNTEYWIEKDGFYYYRTPLAGGEETRPLFTTVSFDASMGNLYKDSKIAFLIRTHGVQANNNGTHVFDATGWPASSIGGQS